MPIGLPTVPLKKQKNHAIRAKVDPDLPALSRTLRERKTSPRAVFAAVVFSVARSGGQRDCFRCLRPSPGATPHGAARDACTTQP